MKTTFGLALVLLASFAAPAVAAPTWLAPQNLSVPPATGGPNDSTVASDAAGETFATWIQTDGTNPRVQLASHMPGQPWSAASNLSDAGQDASGPVLALSSTGFGAIAWTRSDGAHVRVQVSRRSPGGAFGSADTVSLAGVDAAIGINGPDLQGPAVAVDASGDIVVIWQDSATLNLFARRFSAAAGTWGSIATLATAATGEIVFLPTVAISPGGVATAAWSIDDDPSTTTTHYQVQSSTQSLNGTWSSVVTVSATPTGDESDAAQLAIDAAGNVTLVWYLSGGSTVGEVLEASRPAVSGVWQPAVTLSDPLLVTTQPEVATTPAGEVTVAWTENVSNAVKVLVKPVGGSFPAASSANIIAPQDSSIFAGALFGIPVTTLHVATGPTGTLVTFARENGTNYVADAVYRPAGGNWPDPATTPPTALSSPSTDIGTIDGPSATLDGSGNAVVSWTDGNLIQAAAFDVSPPTFGAVSVPATGTTGQPIAMSASASDIWSALGTGQPSWSFGDSTLGAGPALTHTYAAAGTYTVTIGASDAVGNAATPVTRQIVITNPPIPPLPATTIAKPTFKAAWKSNKLVGSVTVTGTVGLATTLKVTVKRQGSTKASVSALFAAKSGAWTHTLKLPSGLAPGTYDVSVTGSGVLSATTTFTLPAPATGIVKRSFATGPPTGPAVTKLGKTSQLWAHFLFGTLPKKGQKITTQWILPSGHKLSPNTRPRTTLVEAQVKDLSGHNLPTGRWRCLIRVGGKVLVTLNVRLT